MRAFRAALFGVLALSLSGCVFLRLLELKRQLNDFDRNFQVLSEDGLSILCRKPVLRQDDLLWLGFYPEYRDSEPGGDQWGFRWVKETHPEEGEVDPFELTASVRFHNGRVEELTLPEEAFTFLSKPLLVSMLRSLGGAAVDRKGRSAAARLEEVAGSSAGLPDEPLIRQMLGMPASESDADGLRRLNYRYVQPHALTEGRPVLLSLFFLPETGRLSRLDGSISNLRISLAFEDTPLTAQVR